MLISYKRGQASVVLRVKILNSSASTGAGLTGLTYASIGLVISTIADNESSATAYTQAGSTIETITTLGTYAAPTATKCRFKEVDATNHKGVYEVQIADARFAVSSAKFLIVSISGATNCAETDVVIPLQDLDPYDAVRANLSALPNANAAASGGLLTAGTGTNQLNPSGGAVPVSGNVNVGSVSSGVIAADVWNATRASYATSGTFGQGAASVQGNVTGSVASVSGNVSGNVTGSVGSVAGNVGGNVAGSVGSISGVTFPPNFSVLAIAATTGQVGIDFSNIKQATGGTTLSNITIPTVTTVTTANINLSQAIPTSNTEQTVGDSLNAARAQGFGKWVLSGTTLTLFAPDNSTPVRTFTLDNTTAPTQRS